VQSYVLRRSLIKRPFCLLLERLGGLIGKIPLAIIPSGFLTRAARELGMIVGYSRVSTTEQNLDLQLDALKRAGCEKIIEDTVSGGKVQRLGIERVHDALRSGDMLAVGGSTGWGGRSSI
jgi:Resolvase, N terminal domain